MEINEFIKKYEIAIFADADLRNKSINIRKMDIELESYDLFEQLILFGNTESLLGNISGQLLPRIWTQGNTKCIVSQPNDEHIIALFYNKCLNAKENYLYAKQLDLQLSELF